MSTIDTVTRYFKRELEPLGYPTEKVYWSLSYCQGDGMAFYGRQLDSDELAKIEKRLLKRDQRRMLDRLKKRDVRWYLEIEAYDHHYNHWNSMRVSVTVEGDHNLPKPLTEKQNQIFTDLEEAIKDDVKEVSHRLEDEGYKILQACAPMWWNDYKVDFTESRNKNAIYRAYNVGRFKVTVHVEESEDFDGYESGDDEMDHQVIKRMIAGEIVIYDMRVTIEDAESGMDLGEARTTAVSDDKCLSYSRETRLELMSEAVAEARHRMARFAPAKV